MLKPIKKKLNPEIDKFQFYTEIPKENYELTVSSVYFVNKLFYLNCLLEFFGTFFPVLFIRFNSQKLLFSVPQIFSHVQNADEILNSIARRYSKTNINSLGHEPKILFFDETRFQKLFPINFLNLYRFPSIITSDIGSIISTIARYSYVRNFIREHDDLLDFGCGTGIGSFVLARDKNVQMVSLDIDRYQIEFAKKLYNPWKIHFIQNDILKFNPQKQFDFIISSEVFEHTEEWNQILQILRNTLKEKGSIFITLPNFYYHTSSLNSDHRIDWTKRKVEKLFGVKPLYLIHHTNVFDYRVAANRDAIPENFLFFLPKNHKEPEDTELKSVLFVNHSVYPFEKSGTPLCTHEQAKALKEKGIKTGVLIPDCKVQNTFEKEDLDGIVIYKIPALEWQSIWLNTFLKPQVLNQYLTLIEEIVEDFNPQIVHVNDYVAMCPHIIKFFSDLGCRVVRWVHADEEICWRIFPVIEKHEVVCSGPDDILKCSRCINFKPYDTNEYFRIFDESVYVGNIHAHIEYINFLYRNFVDGIIFASESFKKHFIKYVPIPEEKTAVIPIGFDRKAKRKLRTPGDKIVFGFMGTLNFRKGTDLLCMTAEKLIESGYRNFEIRIFGLAIEDKYCEKIKTIHEKSPDTVKYYGEYPHENLDEILEGIDVGLVLSNWESYSRVLREFLLRGIPVICTDFIGSEIVRDGINGFKVPIGDETRIYEAMVRLIKEKRLVENLSKQALITEIPSKEEEIDRLIELYSSLLRETPYYENDNTDPKNYPRVKNMDLSNLSSASFLMPEVEKIERMENTLDSIYSSRLWKIFSIYHRTKNAIFPTGTKRRQILDKLLFSETRSGHTQRLQ